MKKSFYFLIALLLVVIVPAGTSISVKAIETEYSLYINIVGNGVVTYNGSSPYIAGSIVALTAYPDTGWEFSGWSGDLGGNVNPEFLVMDSNKTVTVTFTEIPEYSLYINIVGNGVVTYNGSSPYIAGSIVALTAYPDTGWEFSGWSGDLGGNVNPEFLVMDSNKTVTVTFTEIPEYSLYINIVGNGIVTYNGSSPYTAGSIVALTAYPDTGWEFSGWSGDLGGNVNPEFLVMDSNKTVTVTFTEIPEYIPTIESCDSTGTKKDTFVLSDKVYATGTGYQPSTNYDVYLVEDVTWVDGMAIPPRVSGTATSISSDASGNVPATLLWNDPLVAGKYDIVVDFDGDGLYYIDSDALDDNDIEVTAGFFAIPEVPLGTLMASLATIIGLIFYITIRKK